MKFLLTLVLAGSLHAGVILDGVFHWDDTGIVQGSMVGTHKQRGFSLIDFKVEDQTFCTLDMYSRSLGGDYFPKIAMYQDRLRPDMFFNAEMWHVGFQRFDFNKWAGERRVVTIPFQTQLSWNVLGGNPDTPMSLFTVWQGLKGKATLTIIGGRGQRTIQDAEFEITNSPEPATMFTMATGLAAGITVWRRRRKSQS